MTRRRGILAGIGLAAAVGGLGWQQWSERRAAPPRRGLPATADATPWTLRFPRPAGGELVMASYFGQPLLLNFWATWCPPCVEEMPEFDRFQRTHSSRGWRVVGLAVDNEGPVRAFLQQHPVAYDIGIAGFDGAELSQRLGNDKGALPFTVAFDSGGSIRHRKPGRTSYDELMRWAAGT